MKIKIYCYRSHKLNTKSVSLVMWEGFCGLSVDRFSHRRWDTKPEDVREFLDAKRSKIDSLLFRDKCKKKKKTIHKPVTIEYQLNDSLFSSFNGTSLMRWWIHECYIFKKGWRNKIIEDHDRLTDHDSRKPMARVFPASFNDSPFNLAPGPRR